MIPSKLLIVEDEEGIRVNLKNILPKRGLAVDVAKNSLEALALVGIARPDVIVFPYPAFPAPWSGMGVAQIPQVMSHKDSKSGTHAGIFPAGGRHRWTSKNNEKGTCL